MEMPTHIVGMCMKIHDMLRNNTQTYNFIPSLCIIRMFMSCTKLQITFLRKTGSFGVSLNFCIKMSISGVDLANLINEWDRFEFGKYYF